MSIIKETIFRNTDSLGYQDGMILCG